MSLFPGEMTKQSFVAPPITMRSTRYSLTARGRSVAPSRRIPTGKSSFENASGWMRLPIPAAGMIPPPPSPSDEREQLVRALLRGVLRQRPLPRRAADPRQFLRRAGDRGDGIAGVARDEDLLAWPEELPHAFPEVRQHRHPARGGLEQAPRRAPS